MMFSRVSRRCALCFFIASGDAIFQREGSVLALALQTILRLLDEAARLMRAYRLARRTQRAGAEAR
jgi:hypothetical protein